MRDGLLVAGMPGCSFRRGNEYGGEKDRRAEERARLRRVSTRTRKRGKDRRKQKGYKRARQSPRKVDARFDKGFEWRRRREDEALRRRGPEGAEGFGMKGESRCCALAGLNFDSQGPERWRKRASVQGRKVIALGEVGHGQTDGTGPGRCMKTFFRILCDF